MVGVGPSFVHSHRICDSAADADVDFACDVVHRVVVFVGGCVSHR